MNVRIALSLIMMWAGTGCSDKPTQNASTAPSPPPKGAPAWEIGEDIAGNKVMIDGKQMEIPSDVADSKRKMDAVATEKLDAMGALEKKRLERFHDPDVTP